LTLSDLRLIYAISLRTRKRIDAVLGRQKSAAGEAKTRFRHLLRVRFAFRLTVPTYKPMRLPKAAGRPNEREYCGSHRRKWRIIE
jgi:hypothetical protein